MRAIQGGSLYQIYHFMMVFGGPTVRGRHVNHSANPTRFNKTTSAIIGVPAYVVVSVYHLWIEWCWVLSACSDVCSAGWPLRILVFSWTSLHSSSPNYSLDVTDGGLNTDSSFRLALVGYPEGFFMQASHCLLGFNVAFKHLRSWRHGVYL